MPLRTEPGYSTEQIENDLAALRGQVGDLGEIGSPLNLGLSGLGAQFPGTPVTAASFQTVASATIPANLAVPGAVYEMWVHGHGTQGSTAQGVGIQVTLGGTVIGGSMTSGNGFAATSQAFRWRSHVILVCVTNGSTATWMTSYNLHLCQMTAASNAQFILNGSAGTNTQDSTVANVFAVQLEWGSTTGAPTLTSDFSLFRRTA